MKRYSLTSHLFEGSVIFGFNEQGWLVFYKNEAEFTAEQQDWLFEIKDGMSRFPVHLFKIQSLASVIKGELKELPPDLSFEVFWDAYDKKVHRKRAEPIYKKLSEADRLKAITEIKPYQKACQRTNRGIADPEKYLRSAYYETDWSKVK